MALDEAMLEAHATGSVPATLRVYGWRPPAVSLGKFQRLESSVEVAACRALGYDIVRRPTGGRAILHTAEEVTFSLVVSAASLGTTGVMDSYRKLGTGIVSALRLLGLDARLVERGGPAPTSQASPAPALDPACFATKARCDLVVGSSKLVGSAQVQRKGFLLQQNSLPLRIRLDNWSRVFLRAEAPPEAVGLCDAAHREVGYAEVASALRDGFEEALGITFWEEAAAEEELSKAGDSAGQYRL
jgi:lipoate-protein ligase A